MNDDTPTPLEVELEFMRVASSATGGGDPDLWAIRRKIHAYRRRRLAMRTAAVAATLCVVAAAGIRLSHSPRATAPLEAAAGVSEAEYLQAALAQLKYETGLLKAQVEYSARPAAPAPQYEDTAVILLESARYWERIGGDSELSRARYAEILVHFPQSAAAATVATERPKIVPSGTSL